MNILSSFDPKKHMLGGLCKNNHSFWDTGRSLRNFDRGCVECKRLNAQKNKDRVSDLAKLYRESNKEKIQKRQKRWYEENKNRILESRKEQYKENRESILAEQKEYYQENKEYIKERSRQWREKNKEELKVRANARKEAQGEAWKTRRKSYLLANRERFADYARQYVRTPRGRAVKLTADNNRRIRKRGAHTVEYESSEWYARTLEFDSKCAYCLSEHRISIDHFIPISKGGSDCLGNFIPACTSCNSSKSNKDAEEWYKKQPFYDRKRWNKILKVLGKSKATLNQIPLF